ncbi:MAG TPA: toll/interleukin-1 receptor domain-containing protein [Gammaproteobacteria bacterium]
MASLAAVLLSACSVDEVAIRLNRDLSGQFTTIMAVDLQNEDFNCRPAAGDLRDYVTELVALDPQLQGVLQYSAYNDNEVGGVRTVFRFDSPDDIPLRIGQLQNLPREQRDEDEANSAFSELMEQFDSIPVDFESQILPVRSVDGERIYEAEFSGDPSVLLTYNLFADDPSTHCTRDALTFNVTMPTTVVDFSPVTGRASATQVNASTVSWNVPREGGEVVLRIRATEPDPDWVPPRPPDPIPAPPEPEPSSGRTTGPSGSGLVVLGAAVLAAIGAAWFLLLRRRTQLEDADESTPPHIDRPVSDAQQHFFSYSRTDSDFVLKLARRLQEKGVNVWLNQICIDAGEHWDSAVERALKTSESLIVVLSPRSVSSADVLDEVTYGLSEKKAIIPVLYEPCDIPLRLRRINYVDFTQDFESALTRLVERVGVWSSDEETDSSN